MLKEVIVFEWRYQIRRPVSWILFLLLLSFILYIYASMGGILGTGFSPPNTNGKVWLNGPYVTSTFTTSATFVGMIIVPAIFGAAAIRDFKNQSQEIVFSLPFSEKSYFFGHFIGAFLVAMFVFSAIPIAIVIASILPGMDPDRFGPIKFMPLFISYVYIIVPNLFIAGTCFYTLAINIRRLFASYVVGLSLFYVYVLVVPSFISTDSIWGVICDPFAQLAILYDTQYWSAIEQNTKEIPLSGNLLINRLFWIILGVIILITSFKRFKMEYKEDVNI